MKVRRRLKVQLAHEDPEDSSKLYNMHTQTKIKIPCTGYNSILYQHYTKEQNNNVLADRTIETPRCGILTRWLLMNSARPPPPPAVQMNILIFHTRFPVLHTCVGHCEGGSLDIGWTVWLRRVCGQQGIASQNQLDCNIISVTMPSKLSLICIIHWSIARVGLCSQGQAI